MQNLLVLPIAIPLLAATLALLGRGGVSQRILGVGGALGILATGIILVAMVTERGPLVMQAGNWPAPFGITFVADLLSAILVTLTGVIGVAVMIFSLQAIDHQRERFGYYPLLLILLMGVCGAFLTGDIFNLYVWFEVLLIASFVLLALGSEQAQMEGAINMSRST